MRSESKYNKEEKPVDAKTHGVDLPAVQENEEEKDVFRIPPKGSMSVDEANEAFEGKS